MKSTRCLLEELLHEAVVGLESPLEELRPLEEDVRATLDANGEGAATDSQGLGEKGHGLLLSSWPPRIQLQWLFKWSPQGL